MLWEVENGILYHRESLARAVVWRDEMGSVVALNADKLLAQLNGKSISYKLLLQRYYYWLKAVKAAGALTPNAPFRDFLAWLIETPEEQQEFLWIEQALLG